MESQKETSKTVYSEATRCQALLTDSPPSEYPIPGLIQRDHITDKRSRRTELTFKLLACGEFENFAGQPIQREKPFDQFPSPPSTQRKPPTDSSQFSPLMRPVAEWHREGQTGTASPHPSQDRRSPQTPTKRSVYWATSTPRVTKRCVVSLPARSCATISCRVHKPGSVPSGRINCATRSCHDRTSPLG